MQKLIGLCTVFAVVAVVCSVELSKAPVQIIRQETNKAEDGSYTYVLETDDGYFKEETGTVINPGSEDPKVRVSGSYHYIDAVTGETVSVEYTADENGFYPSGSHIAKEISEAALKSKDNTREPQKYQPKYQQPQLPQKYQQPKLPQKYQQPQFPQKYQQPQFPQKYQQPQLPKRKLF